MHNVIHFTVNDALIDTENLESIELRIIGFDSTQHIDIGGFPRKDFQVYQSVRCFIKSITAPFFLFLVNNPHHYIS